MPTESSASDRVLELAEEFVARHRRGERPRVEEYARRHPDLADEIRQVFPALAMMENIAPTDGPSLDGSGSSAPPGGGVKGVLGDFRLIREVGRGGMGVVYEAEQVSLGRFVALKVLPVRMTADARQRQRFEREARAAARLHHTNIVPVFGVGEHDGVPFYVMQFIPGQGLDAVIAELRAGDGSTPERPASLAARAMETGVFAPPAVPDRIDAPGADTGVVAETARVGLSSESAARLASGRQAFWASAARVGVQVAGALEYAHRQGVLHRDVKPSNLLLDAHGTAWVTDFGLAKAEGQPDLTHTGDLLGTLRYMPPEAFDGRYDARSDVYALGLTLFELLALRPAFDERDRNRMVRRVMTGDPPRLRKHRPDAPRDLVTVVEKAIERDPGRRYQSAGALADDLQRYLDGRPITARRATELQRAWMWALRRPAIAWLVAASVFFLLAGSVVSAVFAVRADGFAHDADLREREANAALGVARAEEAKAVAARDDARR
ncbi:MAG TPA: serine/threonine-protein kinase, partial [Fimbriiglobus sp.]|nr:serine/threonine-protein kinase [Fimbriiglobus sp.]